MSDTSEVTLDLRLRTLQFSKLVLKFLKPYQNKLATRSIADQLLRSATSIGANFIEAKNSGSRKDFRHKVIICKKEAAETIYWLELIKEFAPDKIEILNKLQQECREIMLILQKIITTVDLKH